MATPTPIVLDPAATAALDRALARADAYRLLAAGLRDPDDPDAVGELDVAALRSAAQELRSPVAAAAWPAVARIRRRGARAAEHRLIFGHTVAHGCPPYETEYGRRHVFGQSQELGDIRGFYEAFGVRPRRRGERPDHVACELEFIALLAIKEATALATGDQERLGICRAAAAQFLADHLGRWLPALAGRIGRRAPHGGYAALAAVAAALVSDHARDVGVSPVPFEPDDLAPIVEEPHGFAFECGIDSAGGDLAPPGAG
jgi:TorA maturation chaperone TorD